MTGETARWPFPERRRFEGRCVDLEPLSREHVPGLWRSARGAEGSFDFLRYGPFASERDMLDQVVELAGRADQPFWAVRPKSSRAAEGWLSLCDIFALDGAIEIGSIWFAPSLQRTRAATEAIYLLMRYAMDVLGYQRLVWRCLEANQPSMRAAARYGFVPEGRWRGSVFLKGRRWDQAWHSIVAEEWPGRSAAIAAWIADENFDDRGRALAPLRR